MATQELRRSTETRHPKMLTIRSNWGQGRTATSSLITQVRADLRRRSLVSTQRKQLAGTVCFRSLTTAPIATYYFSRKVREQVPEAIKSPFLPATLASGRLHQ